MIFKVAIVGSHGSGKTTLGYELVSALKKESISVVLTNEVARNSPYLSANERTIEMQVDLFGKQIAEEMERCRNAELLICDRSLLDIVMYSKLFFSKIEDERSKAYLNAMESFLPYYMATYDLIYRTTRLYTPKDTPDQIRPRDRHLQNQAHQNIEKMLVSLKIDYIDLPAGNTKDFILKDLSKKGII